MLSLILLQVIGLPMGEQYSFRVCAYNSANAASAYSAEVTTSGVGSEATAGEDEQAESMLTGRAWAEATGGSKAALEPLLLSPCSL